MRRWYQRKRETYRYRAILLAMGIMLFWTWDAGQRMSNPVKAASGEDIGPAEQDDQHIIYEGIYLDTVNVGGMTKEQATETYSKYVKGIDDLTLTLTSSVGSYTIPLKEIKVDVDVEEAVEEAFSYGRKGNILTRYKEIQNLSREPVTIIPKKEFDRDKLEDLLTNDAWDLMKQAKNATVARIDGEFVVYSGEDGVSLMTDRTVEAVAGEFEKVWQAKSIKLSAVTEVTHPEYTEEDFYGIDSLLGRYATEYSNRAPERIQNLTVGAGKIADSVVLPGQQFSVYDTVAPFTEENGYGNAGQYVNDELVDGLGGGICQVSTTLYNAVLEAELQVDERYPHSMTVDYVKKGMDAAIAEGYEDFRFTHNTEYPIYIDAYAGGGVISVAIYGHETRPSNRRIEFESQVIEEFEPGAAETIYDANLPAGEERVTYEHKGYYVEVWKHIYVDGELTDSVKVSGSQYNAVPRKTRIGTGGTN